MPSFTSNSDFRLPTMPWVRIWLLTIILAIVCLSAYEGLWRWKGFVPMPKDDISLWMLQRNKVRPNDRDQVVILGASQSQTNYDLGTFETEYGRRPIQLAVLGSNCLPTLDHFANDDSFQGSIIADVVDYIFYGSMYPSIWDAIQQRYVDKYEHASLDWRLEAELSTLINMNFTFRLNELNVGNVFRSMALGKWPKLPHSIVSLDREQRSFFSKNEPIKQNLMLGHVDNVLPADHVPFQRDIPKVRDRVERITKRGGRVYFVVMPLAGVTRKESLSLFPRELFFDKLVAESRASGGIHYMDYGDLRTLVPPDGTHLDQSDMTRFTKSFVGILNEKLKIK